MPTPSPAFPWRAGTTAVVVDRARDLSGPRILAPVLAGLPPALADLAAALPIGDANARLLAELDQRGDPVPSWLVAGVLTNDPFRGADALLVDLERRGVRAVINWPSVGLLAGELASAYEHSGFTLAAELGWLRRARERGMAALALVADGDSARAALAEGVDGLVVSPGLAVPDPGQRGEAAAATERLLDELAAERAPVWLYAHPDFGAGLGRSVARADGVVQWGAGNVAAEGGSARREDAR